MDNNKEYVFVKVISRSGSSSLEIALQELGYKTIYLTPSRLSNDIKKKVYELATENVKNNKPILENIKCDFNCFIYSVLSSDYLNLLYKSYPNAKFILTDRKFDEWIISFKRHQKASNRPILTTEEYSSMFSNYKNEFINCFSDKPESSHCIFNSSTGDNYKKLCKFLNKKVINKPFPCINSNKNKKKCDLTKDEINK
jgi:hypothetical protein